MSKFIIDDHLYKFQVFGILDEFGIFLLKPAVI